MSAEDSEVLVVLNGRLLFYQDIVSRVGTICILHEVRHRLASINSLLLLRPIHTRPRTSLATHLASLEKLITE
jgi:hypothetical protein